MKLNSRHSATSIRPGEREQPATYSPPSSAFVIRPAVQADVPHIAALISSFAADKLLLKRNVHEIREQLAYFIVGMPSREHSAPLLGCSSLYRYHSRLAEIRSFCVNPAMQGQGLARKLMEATLAKAQELAFRELIVITREADAFFAKFGFTRTARETVEEKVLKDCVTCSCYGNCPAKVYRLAL